MVRSLFLVAFLAIGLIRVTGQPVPRLDPPALAWFQRGTTQQVTLTGEALLGARQVFVNGRGVAGILGAMAAKGPADLVIESSRGGLSAGTPSAGDAKTVVLQLAFASDAPLGSREVRVATTNGVSNPVTVNVSDLPEIAEKEPNHTPAGAQRITLPVAISGVIRTSTETDLFRFQGHPGEHLIFDVQANRTGSPLDATLLLLDATGKELARSEDAHGLDPFLEFVPPAEGEYLLKIFDLRFQGGADYRYRLVAGALPYLEGRYPFGGRRGSSVDVALNGINLDGRDKLAIAIDPAAPQGSQEIRIRTPRGSSNPLQFESGDLPELSETEPNDSTTNATPVTAPVVINGRIGTARDVDTFRLKAAGDQKLVIEVRARRLGSPLDALLTLSDAKGAVLQRNDDAGGPDARIEFDAKKDAEYFVSLRDLTDRGGDRFGYRLSIQPPDVAPDFTVRVTQDRIRVHAGDHTAVRCEVERRNGFNGAVQVTGGSLPAGLSANTLILGPEGPQNGWLVLSAASESVPGHHAFVPQAEAMMAGRRVIHSAVLPSQGFLTVLPAAPFSIGITTPSATIEQNTGVPLTALILRQPGFTGEVKLVAEDLPGISIPAVTVPGDQSRAVLQLSAAYTAETSIRSLMVRAEASVDGSMVATHAAAAVPVTVTGIPVFLTAMLPGSPFFRTDGVKLSVVALPAASESPARTTEYVIKADRRSFNGMIPLRIEDLPEGVSATVEPLGENSKLATIRLAASEKTAAKEHTFTVVGTFTAGDRIWHQRTQKITLQVTTPEKDIPVASATTNAPAPATIPAAGVPK